MWDFIQARFGNAIHHVMAKCQLFSRTPFSLSSGIKFFFSRGKLQGKRVHRLRAKLETRPKNVILRGLNNFLRVTVGFRSENLSILESATTKKANSFEIVVQSHFTIKSGGSHLGKTRVRTGSFFSSACLILLGRLAPLV